VSSELAPSFLVAMDLIVDPNFQRSVVLMLEYDEAQGAVGLVVNRSTDLRFAEPCDNLEISCSDKDPRTVDWGGPVQQDQGWVLLGDEAAEGLEVETALPGIHWSRGQDALERMARAPRLGGRIFLGYAGWGAGQLEEEIAQGSWLVVPPCEGIVFEAPLEEMWERAVRSLGIEPATLVSSPGMN
jgi:putative transcriptional regulator